MMSNCTHILVKVDIFCSKSLDQLLMVRREAGEGNGKEEEKERHERVSKCKTNCALNLPII